MKNHIITIRDTEVAITPRNEQDYISLTNMVRNFDGGSALIKQWLKNKDTVLFLGAWEQLNNPVFNSLEFEGIKNEAGRNSFFLSAKKWIDAPLITTIVPMREEKLSWQKKQRELEGKRSKLRRELFARQDEVEKQRNNLIDQLEKQLRQRLEERTLFAHAPKLRLGRLQIH